MVLAMQDLTLTVSSYKRLTKRWA